MGWNKYIRLGALFIAFGIAFPAFADEDVASLDWSVNASRPLDKYPPAPYDLAAFVNRVLDTDWNMGLCASKFIDVFDGAYRLVASLDTNGRHACNELVVIAETGGHSHIVNKLKAISADDIGGLLRDLDHDHSPELVITQNWSRPEAGHCTATWQKIYKWDHGHFTDQSASFPDIYQGRRAELQNNLARDPDPTCHEMELDRIARILGAPAAGYDRAAAWMKAPDPSLRRKAVAVFADIGSESAKKNLALLAGDADPLTAESARLYLETPDPNKE